MLVHELTVAKRRSKRRVGRGGKRGTFSGRGTKGQKARAGRRIRPQLRDVIKKIPKQRGRGKHSFKSIGIKSAVVNLDDLEKHFASGERVTPEALWRVGLINRRSKRIPKVKLLGSGVLTKKLLVERCQVSGSAKAQIEKLGGTVDGVVVG